jgi:hypothetical protein
LLLPLGDALSAAQRRKTPRTTTYTNNALYALSAGAPPRCT